MSTFHHLRRAAAGVFLALGCTGSQRVVASPVESTPPGAAPQALLGTFVDDYGSRYTITPALWTHLPNGRYQVRRWDAAGGYLIAQNDSANGHAPGRWTRIDWVELHDMAPWTWAFCLSAYDAPTAAAAESTLVAQRDSPRTGCNGHPFSRMRRVEDG